MITECSTAITIAARKYQTDYYRYQDLPPKFTFTSELRVDRVCPYDLP